MTFTSVLKKAGFTRTKQVHSGVVPWVNGQMYAEVYTEKPRYVWAIGGQLPSSSRYPGGWAYDTPEDLGKVLNELNATPLN